MSVVLNATWYQSALDKRDAYPTREGKGGQECPPSKIRKSRHLQRIYGLLLSGRDALSY